MSQSVESVFVAKQSAIGTGALILFATLLGVSNTHAYPGASARELETSVRVKSVCHAIDESKTHQAWFGYTTAGVKPNSKNECPKDYVIALISKPRRVKDRSAMEASSSIGYYDYVSTPPEHRHWTTDYSIDLYENSQRRVRHAVSENVFDGELKSILTASETTPVSFKINYVSREIEPSVRINFAAYEKVIKVVGTCWLPNSRSLALVVQPNVRCDENYQFVVSNVAPTHQAQVGENSQIEVYSQFRMKLFTSSLLKSTRDKLDIDLRTASPEHPVLVTIDTKNNQVLKIEPSISPYAL